MKIIKNILPLLLLTLLLTSCKNEIKKDADAAGTSRAKYETYNYSGFTKEETYAFHKHIYDGGDWTVYGDLERYYYLNVSEIGNHSRILRSDTPKILEETPRTDVKNFLTSDDLEKGGGLSLNDYIQQVEVNGLIIIHKGKIVFEGYPRMFPTDLHINMLITQVFVSTSIAILEERGLVDTENPIDYYFNELKGTGWEGIPVIDILNMSSGMAWVLPDEYETAFDPIQGLAALKSEKPSGTEFKFSNTDALILTLLVEKMSGLPFRDFLEQEIWRKIGTEHSALLAINKNGTSASYLEGMSTTLRDLARFGLAFTPSGRKDVDPIISEAHLSNIQNENKTLRESERLGEMIYTSYLWHAVFDDGDFYKGAHGGQGLYVSPAKDLVIAFFGTANTDRERNQLHLISRQLVKSGLFDLE